MKTPAAFFHTARQRALAIWALVLSAAVLSAFVHTVQDSRDRGEMQRLHAQAMNSTEDFVVLNASLATAR